MRFRLTLAVFAAVLAFGANAHAQLTGLAHVWTVPGVMNTVDGLGTFIACTNGGIGQTIGVDVYDSDGEYVTGYDVFVGRNATMMFGTRAATGISVDVNLATGTVSKGLAQVLADSKHGVMCSAFIADAGSAIPASMVSLSVVKKNSQKGD